MKLIKEHITRFERGGDPYRKLGVGKIALIDKWFSDLDIGSDRYTIDKDFNINVRGSLDLSGTNITSLLNNLNVGGYLYLEGTNITSLPNDLSVGWSLDLRGTNITSLPDNLSVGENIWLSKNRKGKVYVPKHLKKKVKYMIIF